MMRTLWVLFACLVLSACGGGGGGGGGNQAASTAPTTPVAAPLTNFTTLTVDTGPAALTALGSDYYAYNMAYVTVTLCAPGSTTNCQTIDHVQVDTGSVGLRIPVGVLNASLLSAMPLQTDASANPVGECFGFVEGYVFGGVRQADFQIGGEAVAGMPLQVIGDTAIAAAVPSSCSSGGGSQISTVTDLGANGLIGIGPTTTDCGSFCTTPNGYSAAIYYDCPAAGCSAIITRSAATTAPFQQLPNPVAAMAVDNNGTIITLPAAPAAGEASMTGTLTFGIGTQTNNSLGTATVLTATTSASKDGAGFITATYNGQTLNQSYIDSGTNLYLFADTSLAACTGADFVGYYCPSSPQSLSPQIVGTNGATASAAFVLYNAQTLLNTTNAVLPGLGANPNQLSNINDFPSSFAFGLPFFYGRSVYTALEGRTAGGTAGPYFAY